MHLDTKDIQLYRNTERYISINFMVYTYHIMVLLGELGKYFIRVTYVAGVLRKSFVGDSDGKRTRKLQRSEKAFTGNIF
jgi:hypothetical protein